MRRCVGGNRSTVQAHDLFVCMFIGGLSPAREGRRRAIVTAVVVMINDMALVSNRSVQIARSGGRGESEVIWSSE